MIISNPSARLNYDQNDPNTVINVTVTAQITELFGNAQSSPKEVTITILSSEYNANIAPDALLTLVKSKIKDRITSGAIYVHLLNINYGGPVISFRTADTDVKNTVALDASIIPSKEELDTALASGITGVQKLVLDKLVAEFS
jgi:hypothetical protein